MPAKLIESKEPALDSTFQLNPIIFHFLSFLACYFQAYYQRKMLFPNVGFDLDIVPVAAVSMVCM